MNNTPNINLFTNKNRIPEYITPIQQYLHRSAILCLLATVTLSILTGIIYMIVSTQYHILTTNKEKYIHELTLESEKENILSVIKSRTGVIDKAIKGTRKLSLLLTNAYEVASPPKLFSLSIGDFNNVSLAIKVNSVEEAVDVTSKLLNQVHNNKIFNPILDEFMMDKSGISIMFTYSPVWN